MDYYTERFEREYRDAKEEYERLRELLKDVCWYHFETVCASWRDPWRESVQDSEIELHGMRFTRKWSRGCLMEHGEFPVYYLGPLRGCPSVPPEIVALEVQEAFEYMKACERQVSAPRDWAPGGPAYEALRRTTTVGRQCVYDPRKKRRFSSTEAA